MSRSTLAWVLAVLLLAGCTSSDEKGSAAPKENPPNPLTLAQNQVVIGERIAFTGADGKAVVPMPGVYRVAAAGDDELRIFLGAAKTPYVLKSKQRKLTLKEAQRGTLKAPRAVLYRDEESPARALWLFHPDGTVHEAAGSPEGERARGILLGDDTVETASDPVFSLERPHITITSPAVNEVYWNRFDPLQVKFSSSGVSLPIVSLVQRVTQRVVAFAYRGAALHGLYHLDPGTYDLIVSDSLSGISDSRPIRVVGRIRSLSAGNSHTLALGPDTAREEFQDYVWEFGSRAQKNVEFGSKALRAVAVSAGERSSYAIHRDGGVFSWGGYAGSPEVSRPAPGRLPFEVGGDAIEVAAGYDFALVLRDDGTVLSWGKNQHGQCGHGTYGDSDLAGPVMRYDREYKDGQWRHKQLTHVVAIAAGASHAIALRADGTLWGWGDNERSQLDGTVARGDKRPRAIPLQSGWTADNQVRAIAATRSSSLALVEQADGKLRWFGWGDGRVTNRLTDADIESPVAVALVAGLPSIRALGTGQSHILALLPQPRSMCMQGMNPFGCMGYSPPSTSPPAGVKLLKDADLPYDIIAAAGGIVHSVALGWDHGGDLLPRPVLLTWGSNLWGQLGVAGAKEGGERNVLKFK
ncbi:MAG: RCC1 domain-containing protein [Planctomycetota bacterium]